MLHTLRQHHLKRIKFPLGGNTKLETRQLARDFELPVAEKPDSQEICFVAGKNYKAFLREYVGAVPRPGEIVDAGGSVLGTHNGIHEFTIGQRKGLGIAAAQPLYVIALNPKDNLVVVGEREEAMASGLTCSRLSFTGSRSADEFDSTIKVRYRTPDRPGRFRLLEPDRARVLFDKPIWGVAPGQLAVFYEGDTVLGGGTIDESLVGTPTAASTPASNC
jgi:tRNA-specific 2-thiouridylase